ncbi:MAG: hypothetical protein COB84_05810 [Rhodobacteraceae bacterium]|nr:MAG: hypothetical protein COB84_05810 [Paracoccaceae bacterium]
MNFAPILSASLPIKIHLLTVIIAVVLVIIQLVARKGTRQHKWIGRVWVSAMAISAISSFWIHQLDVFYGFSPIHFLSLFVLYNCYAGIQYARKGNIKQHKRSMLGMTIGGLGIAGGFTFLPGRLMHDIFIAGL